MYATSGGCAQLIRCNVGASQGRSHDFTFTASEYEEIRGKSFQVLVVESDSKHVPYLAVRDGEDHRANAVYVRTGTESKEADHDELERLINRRVESGYSSRSVLELEEHLAQLKTLYGTVSGGSTKFLVPGLAASVSKMTEAMSLSWEPNPHYPKEGYDEFIANLITRKKRKIERILEIAD